MNLLDTGDHPTVDLKIGCLTLTPFLPPS